MTFTGLIAKNLLRQRVRAILTLTGIAIAITTVVALGFIVEGMRTTAEGLVQSGGAAFMVAQKGAADLSFSTLPEATATDVAAVPGVAHARGTFLHITKAGSNPYFFLGGVSPADVATQQLTVADGRLYGPDEPDAIVLGRRAATDLGASVGTAVTVSDHRFTVVGIFDSDVLWEDGGGYAPLATVQAVAQRPGTISVVFVDVVPGADAGDVADAVAAAEPTVVTISSAADYGQVDQGIVLVDAANAAISLLAVVIGGIGVMNTMIMSVFERTREIGVLRAVGWRPRRVLEMVLIESLALCLVAAAFGTILGFGASRLVALAPSVSGLIEPAYSPAILVRAFVVAALVGAIGALYPAVRAARLLPVEALRYE